MRQSVEEDLRRHVEEVFAFALATGFRLHQVVLDDPAGGSVGLVDDDVAKSDVHTLVWSGGTERYSIRFR